MTILHSPPRSRPKHSRPKRRKAGLVAIGFLLAAAAGGGAGAAIAMGGSPPGGSPNSLDNFMGLSPLPGKVAPGFTLTDQSGRPVSLAQFRGKAVVLMFMDPKCTDICPLIAAELLRAQADLGPKARNVVFLAVNANPLATSVSDVAAFTSEHNLGALRTWRFGTANPAALTSIWAHYGVLVQVDKAKNVVLHGDQIYFIGPHGHERYLASPNTYYIKNGTAYLPPNQLARWGAGIAHYAGKLAP